MDAKHTPGPWVRSGGGGVVTGSGLTETLSSGRVVRRRVASAKGTTTEEVSANADLIAAAFEYDAAVKAAIKGHVNEGDFVAIPREAFAMMAVAYSKAHPTGGR